MSVNSQSEQPSKNPKEPAEKPEEVTGTPVEPKKPQEPMNKPVEDVDCNGEAKNTEAKSHAAQLMYTQKMLWSTGEVTIMVAGKQSVGKSTVLNNLLNLKLPTGTGPESVTKEVTAKSTELENGARVQGIDTPGLKAVDLGKGKVYDDMTEKLKENSNKFTLLYCISVHSSRLGKDDQEIVKQLTYLFGTDIWKRCILVLTFCDSVRQENFQSGDQDEAYKEHLRGYAKAFEDLLEKCTSGLRVKSIFDCLDTEILPDVDDKSLITEIKASPETIVAIPAARTREKGRDSKILPGFKTEGNNISWIEYSRFEIMKKSGVLSVPEIRGTGFWYFYNWFWRKLGY